MPDYSPNEIVDILLILGECRHNYKRAAALYRRRFPRRQLPNDTTIHNIEIRVRRGNLRRQRRKYNNNDRAMNPRFLEVMAMVHVNPHVSLREIQRTLGIPKSTAGRYLKAVRYHPYHITLNQALIEQDHRDRLLFCQWASQQIRNDGEFFNYVLFSDEATFHSTGILNRHNCHYWAPVNPHWMGQIDNQHRWSLTVWCGIINGYLIGPYFFDGMINGETYLQLLQNELPDLLQDVDIDTRRRMWLQQDGAGPHFANIVKNFLNNTFPNRWIGRGGPVKWPARSPDLTSLDFYLWGYLKDVVYQNAPTTRDDMKERIRAACNIPRNVLLRTVRHFERRIQYCQQVNGATFEHLIN